MKTKLKKDRLKLIRHYYVSITHIQCENHSIYPNCMLSPVFIKCFCNNEKAIQWIKSFIKSIEHLIDETRTNKHSLEKLKKDDYSVFDLENKYIHGFTRICTKTTNIDIDIYGVRSVRPTINTLAKEFDNVSKSHVKSLIEDKTEKLEKLKTQHFRGKNLEINRLKKEIEHLKS